MQLIKSITNVANYHKPLRLLDSLIFLKYVQTDISHGKKGKQKYTKNIDEKFSINIIWCCGVLDVAFKQTYRMYLYSYVSCTKFTRTCSLPVKTKTIDSFIWTHTGTLFIYISRVRTLYKYKCSIWLVCNGSFSSSLAMKIDGFQFLSDLPLVCFALRCVAYGLALPDFPYFSFNTIPRKKTQLLFVFWIEIQIYDKFKRPLCTERFC